jgi:hypothetical protein
MANNLTDRPEKRGAGTPQGRVKARGWGRGVLRMG